MANLNLSQFTEKTFVADADWTFVWDAAGLISKKVSRNNWLNSGTLATSAPVTISQTWDAGTNVMTALKVVATDTASGTASKLLELWSGSTPALKSYVTKLGTFVGGVSAANSTAALAFPDNGSYSVGIYSPASYKIQFAMASGGPGSAVAGAYLGLQYEMTAGVLSWGITAQDIVLARDSANTLALRNGAAAQTFNVYGTWTTAITNFERLAIKYNATDLAYQIAAEKGTTNGDYRPLDFVTGGSRRMTIGTTGNVGIGTTSPSSKLHVVGDVTLPNGGSIFFGGGFNIYGTTSGTLINGPTAFGQVSMSVNGVIKWLFNYDGLLCGGGTTASFPALKRSTTTLQTRLADDSAFAPIQGKLTTDTAFTSGAITDTGYIVLYDSTGAAYKVACTPV